jgi:rod shape determining protein RodA
MGKRDPVGLRNIDLFTFSFYIALVALGWIMVFAVSYSREWANTDVSFFATSAGKQTIWIGICAVVFALIFIVDWKFWQTFAYLIYSIGIVLLVAVLFFGKNIKGATAWFAFGSFSFQPSEVAKFATCLAVATFLSHYRTNLKETRSQLIALGLLGLPVGLIMLQPDAGSAIVFLSFFLVMYREGLSPVFFIVAFCVGLLFILGLIVSPYYITLTLAIISLFILASRFRESRYWLLSAGAVSLGVAYAIKMGFFKPALLVTLSLLLIVMITQWVQNRGRVASLLLVTIVVGSGISFASNFGFNKVLKPHQQDRINVWLAPSKADPRGSLYNVFQSKLAIGSGGLQGKGFLQGTLTKLNYVPEQSTDFIFCTIGEEHGFIGSSGMILLFLFFMFRITVIAERQRSNFSRHYAYCVAGILFIHFFINIGMTMGLLPIIGIPLPFISKGGSSLLGFTVMIAVLLKLDSNRYKI